MAMFSIYNWDGNDQFDVSLIIFMVGQIKPILLRGVFNDWCFTANFVHMVG